MTYDLFQVDILEKLRDREWFPLCISDYYQRVAIEWGCIVEISERRLQESRDFWLDDASRTLSHGFIKEPETLPVLDPPLELDHFKHASILTFWLRRLVAINATDPVLPGETFSALMAMKLSDEQKHFMQYGNELCALFVGFMLVLNYELQVEEKRRGKSFAQHERKTIFNQVTLPRRFVWEYPQLLKHKNFSWHAIYTMFHSMFETHRLIS